ncbi:helix-turn-helix domain-containing protein [Polaribacter sp. Hel_I_88]|uniref:AraC family transcriptional regulator n=1 Tax=Polaribacter sp. Hel_I_88 TaxID=1250006 RepID=UPI00047C760D|nr:helix-turn-helix domain-containing protein [Polaribacter sp. Hel_I_88]
MEFLHKEDFQHTLFKDITRINYLEDMPEQLISDYGYTYIMLRYGNIEAFNYLDKKVAIPRVFVKGTGDYFMVKGCSNSSWLSIELPNYLLYNITKIHSIKNRNQLIDLSLYVEDDVIESLYTALETIQDIDEIAKITDQHLREYYRDWTIMRPSVEITAYIFNKKGMLTVQELLDVFPHSKRTLERIFAREVGASPYRFICLVRFNNIIRELEKQEHDSLTSLIAKYDYYDQSHFEKDFKKFLGQSIKEYSNNFNPLLTNALAREYVKNNTN